MASEVHGSEPVAYVDRLGYLRCVECARGNDRESPVYDGVGLHGERCDGWCERAFEEIVPAPRAQTQTTCAVPWTVIDRETAYGSTMRLSFGIKVF